MDKTEICGLKGIGPGTKSHRVIPLQSKEKVIIGRTQDNDVCIESNMISRKHAFLTKVDGKWSIMDNKSLNGVHINGQKIAPLEPYTLGEGDKVQLGVSVSKDMPPEFVWTFHTKLRVKKLKGPTNSQTSYCENNSQNNNKDIRKRQAESFVKIDSRGSPIKKASKRIRLSESPPSWSPSSDMKKKLKLQEEMVQQQLAEQQAKLEEMQKLLRERDTAQENLQKELLNKEEVMKEELKKQQEVLESERKKFEEELRQTYEQQLRDKEVSLFTKLKEEKEGLLEEKRLVEERLQTEMEHKLDEKDKTYHEELIKEKDKLDKIIEQKEIHRKMLETQLTESKTESARQKETVLQTKEDILSNFTNLIETELQCSICSELFVKATSLNCSHSYCSQCIEQWMKVKKECPVCRSPITSSIRSLVLDNYIDRMVEHLSDDMKQRRQELVNERNAERLQQEEAAKAAIAAAAAAAPATGRASTSGRGRGRGRRGRGGARTAAPPPPIADTAPGTSGISTRSRTAVITEEILVSSDHEPELDDMAGFVDLGSDFTDEADSDRMADSDEDTDSSVEGDGDAYYGGYGSCFRCGSRGHWANGCPFR